MAGTYSKGCGQRMKGDQYNNTTADIYPYTLPTFSRANISCLC